MMSMVVKPCPRSPKGKRVDDLSRELIALHRAGDETAMGRLIALHEGAVYREAYRVAKRMNASFDEARLEDFRQAARMGIMRAAAKFDPNREVAFHTYATLWMRSMLQRESVQTIMVHTPTKVAATSWKNPPPACFAIGGEWVERLADPSRPDEVERNDHCAYLRRRVANLPERERTCVELHYFRGQTFEQISKAMGFTKQRAYQLLLRGLVMLRETMEER